MRTLLALLLLGALVGCGGDKDTPTGHKADVAFATEMIPHHAQALVMVDMIGDRQVSPEFRALADDIQAAQGPEIEEMVTWLEEWGEDIPETSRDHVNSDHGHGDSHSSGHGMMDDKEMAELDAAGADFETHWLTMMIKHHEGAIEMAETEIANGKDKRAIKLAKDIRSAQRAEIQLMKALAGQL